MPMSVVPTVQFWYLVYTEHEFPSLKACGGKDYSAFLNLWKGQVMIVFLSCLLIVVQICPCAQDTPTRRNSSSLSRSPLHRGSRPTASRGSSTSTPFPSSTKPNSRHNAPPTTSKDSSAVCSVPCFPRRGRRAGRRASRSMAPRGRAWTTRAAARGSTSGTTSWTPPGVFARGSSTLACSYLTTGQRYTLNICLQQPG